MSQTPKQIYHFHPILNPSSSLRSVTSTFTSKWPWFPTSDLSHGGIGNTYLHRTKSAQAQTRPTSSSFRRKTSCKSRTGHFLHWHLILPVTSLDPITLKSGIFWLIPAQIMSSQKMSLELKSGTAPCEKGKRHSSPHISLLENRALG